MALELICYQSDDDEAPNHDRLELELGALGGVDFGAPAEGDYRPWRWRHGDTGSFCDGDLGRSPLDQDPLHPPKRYQGFRELDLRIHLPLAVPHWFSIDCCEFIARLAARIPGLLILNTEDTLTKGGEGPTRFDPVRLQASWETLNRQQMAGLTELPRMDRTRSADLWHYRRAVPAMRRQHGELFWPAAVALQDDGRARSACMWNDAEQPWAVPPVELVVIHRGDDDVAVCETDELLRKLPGRPLGLATAVDDRATLHRVFAGEASSPLAGFRLLADGDWAD